MEKNTIWAIVLSSIVLIGSMLLQNHFFPPQTTVVTEQEVVVSETENIPEQTLIEEAENDRAKKLEKIDAYLEILDELIAEKENEEPQELENEEILKNKEEE